MIMNRYVIKVGTPLTDAIDNTNTGDMFNTAYVSLVDSATNKRYKLYVLNGELTMSEVTN